MNVWDWPPKGRPPTRAELDARWGELNRLLIEHAREGDWGSYRNVRYAQAEQLRLERRMPDAILTMMEVNYLDLEEFGASGLAPVPMEAVLIWILRAGWSEEKAREGFLGRIGRIQASLRTRTNPEKAWGLLGPKWFQEGKPISKGYEWVLAELRSGVWSRM